MNFIQQNRIVCKFYISNVYCFASILIATYQILCTIKFTTITSIKIFNFQLHEQFVDFRLNIEYEMIVFYDSNNEIHEFFKNQLSFQVFHIKFMTSKRKNIVQKQKIVRFRICRNDYCQKFYQLKKK